MENTSMTKGMAMTAALTCARPFTGSNGSHAGDLAQVQGWTPSTSVKGLVGFAGTDRFRGIAAAPAPAQGYAYPHLEAPPV